MNYVKHFNVFGVGAQQIPCITGAGTPTTATEGAVGCLYMDTDKGDVYKCTSANGVKKYYTWENIENSIQAVSATVHERIPVYDCKGMSALSIDKAHEGIFKVNISASYANEDTYERIVYVIQSTFKGYSNDGTQLNEGEVGQLMICENCTFKIRKISYDDLPITYMEWETIDISDIADLKTGLKNHIGYVDKISYYVTPEMFGAVGDGVADDTDAVRSALTSDCTTVILKNKYFVTEGFYITSDKIITGGGTIHVPASDKSVLLFYFPTKNTANNVSINDLHFISERTSNVNTAANGHTRPADALNSNVTFIYINGVENVNISNVTFENSEYDLNLYNCTNVIVDGFTSKNAYQVVWATGCENITFKNGTSVLYEKAGTGDHHYYLGAGIKHIFFSNLKMFSTTVDSGVYPIHFYDSASALANKGNIERAIVENCYVEGGSFVASCCSDDVVIKNTAFKQIEGSSANCFFIQGLANVKFIDCSIETINNLQLGSVMAQGAVYFERCSFANTVMFYGCKTENIFNDCKFYKGVSTGTSGKYKAKFYNCVITRDDRYPVVAAHESESTLEFYFCHLISNYADGIFNCASNTTTTFIKCYGENGASQWLYYNGSNTPTIRMYDCCFPTLKKRQTDTGTIWEEAGNVLADTQ